MDIQKEREAFEDKFPIPAHWIDFDGLTCKYICKYNAIDDQALKYQARWEAWLAAQAQAAEKIEALQNAVIFADDCRKEWHESYMKLRKDKAMPEGFVLVEKAKLMQIVGSAAIIEPITRSNPLMSKYKTELDFILSTVRAMINEVSK